MFSINGRLVKIGKNNFHLLGKDDIDERKTRSKIGGSIPLDDLHVAKDEYILSRGAKTLTTRYI